MLACCAQLYLEINHKLSVIKSSLTCVRFHAELKLILNTFSLIYLVVIALRLIERTQRAYHIGYELLPHQL